MLLTFTTFFTTDKFGRRKLLLVGAASSAVCMIGYAAIYSHTASPTGGLAYLGIVFCKSTRGTQLMSVILWLVTYTQCWTTTPVAVYSEVPALELRSKTLALSSIVATLTGLLVTMTSPFIQNLGRGRFSGQIGYICGFDVPFE